MENFRELYILPEEREIVEKALNDNQQWIFEQIEPMPTIGELIWQGQKEFQEKAMAGLRQNAAAALMKKYGADIPPAIRERLTQELDDIDRAGAAWIVQILYGIRSVLPKEQYFIAPSSIWNSYYLLYLLDITDLDPLPKALSENGHNLLYISDFYWKDQLSNVDIRLSEAAYAIALEYLGKNCGSYLASSSPITYYSDDTQLANRIMQNYLNTCSIDSRKVLEKDGLFYTKILNFGDGRLRETSQWQRLTLLPTNMDCFPIKATSLLPELKLDSFGTGSSSINLLPSHMATVLEACQEKTGISRASIFLDDPTIYQTFRIKNNEERLPTVKAICRIAGLGSSQWFANQVDLLNTCDFPSLLRVQCLSHGTGIWDGCQESLLREGVIAPEQVITCREDVYRYLIQRGAEEKEAADFMTCVYKGCALRKGIQEGQMEMLRRCGAEEWFISVCKKIGYLFPEGHSLPFAVACVQLIWYYLNYPDVVEPLFAETI